MAHYFENTSFYLRLAAGIAAGALLLFTSYYGVVAAVFGMIVFMRTSHVIEALFQANLQHHITDKTRATVGSLPSFLAEALGVLLFGLYGLAASLVSDIFATRMIAVVMIAVAAGLILFWRKTPLASSV